MPVNIAALASKRKVLAVNLDPEKPESPDSIVNVTYMPGEYTQSYLDRINAATTSAEVADLLLKLIVEWDMVTKDEKTGKEKPYPLNKETLQDIGLLYLRLIQTAITEDVMLPKAKPKS